MRPRLRLSSQATAALVVAILSSLYLAAARNYRLGSLSNPGAGLFPLLVGVALLVTSLALLAAEVISARPGRHPAVVSAGDRPRPPFMDRTTRTFAGASILYPIAIAAIGFETATALALAGMSLAMGERRILRLALLACLGVAAGHLVFRRFLAVPLP